MTKPFLRRLAWLVPLLSMAMSLAPSALAATTAASETVVNPLSPPAPFHHVKVFAEPGRFGGWPANHGLWSWGILRDDGGGTDIGYPRTVQRPDGQIVTLYYFHDRPKGDRYIAATIWSPDARP